MTAGNKTDNICIYISKTSAIGINNKNICTTTNLWQRHHKRIPQLLPSPTIACLISSWLGVFLLGFGLSTDATCLILMFDFFCMISFGCSMFEISGIGAAPCWSLGDCADLGSMLGMLGRSMKFLAGLRLISSVLPELDVCICCWRRKRGGSSLPSATSHLSVSLGVVESLNNYRPASTVVEHHPRGGGVLPILRYT